MKIVVLDDYTLNPGDLEWNGLTELGQVKLYKRTPPGVLATRCKGAEAILTNKVPIRKELIDQLPELKYIGVLATGYNVIDTEAARAKGIVVANVPGYSTDSVAQLTFSFILEFCFRVQRHSDAVMRGKWARSKDFSYQDFPLIELAGKTLGIIGMGTIGNKAADIASAFGMKIIGNSRTQTDQSHRPNFEWADIDTLLSTADIVSLHCPLSAQTTGIINAESLKKMKPSAFLINTSRGPLINDQDLAHALNTGQIAGAGLDVLSTEPPPAGNPLFTAKNCLITPHIAWATRSARQRLLSATVANLSAFLAGKPTNVVN